MNLFLQPNPGILELDEEEGRHVTKVLRLNTGDIIHVTNGEGLLQMCVLDINGKRVSYKVTEAKQTERRPFHITMAVAPTRKAERNEWMVEKMIEIGVEQIDFIVTKNTNTEALNRVINLGRLDRIAVAAMKQSQQFFLPKITLHRNFASYIENTPEMTKLLAYVPDNQTVKHVIQQVVKNTSTVLLIGPEGDFTPDEVAMAYACGYRTASLGATRLRTETAAVAGCHAINLANIVDV